VGRGYQPGGVALKAVGLETPIIRIRDERKKERGKNGGTNGSQPQSGQGKGKLLARKTWGKRYNKIKAMMPGNT